MLTVEPPGAVDFGVNVTALLRPAGGEGEESFQLTVCTPGWVAENVAMPKGFAFLRHHLIVERWDEDLVQRAIQDLCLRNEGSNWSEVATKLSRYAALGVRGLRRVETVAARSMQTGERAGVVAGMLGLREMQRGPVAPGPAM